MYSLTTVCAPSVLLAEYPRRPRSMLVFDRNGKFLRTIGKTGIGPGEFRTPNRWSRVETISMSVD
jgi:6-bladed beta-propeller